MTVLLGLLSALAAGTSDFVGGLASRRARAITVTTASQLLGCVVATILALVITAEPVPSDYAWGALAGVAGAAGLMSIYAGYARAQVAIAAPVAGVGTAAFPVLVDSLTGGDTLSATTVVGVVLGLAAIGMISIGRSEATGAVAASLSFGLGGALGLGLLLTGLAQAGEDSGLWPIVAARAAGFVALALVMIATNQPLSVPRAARAHVLAIGGLLTGANAAYLAATRVGSTTVAAVVASMFPAVTVLWAWRVFGERLRPVQLAGIVLALVAVALIAAA